MITKANDTVLDLSDPPRVSQVDMTAGTITTNASAGTEIVNFQTMDTAIKTALPAGVVVPWVTDTPPSGWLLCDGAAFSGATYPALAAILGGTNTPDLRGRVICMRDLGAGLITSPTALFNTRGAEEIQLSDGEMPSHDHNANVVNSLTVTGSGTHNHTGSTSGSGAHSHGGWWGSPLSTGASGDNKNVQDRYQNRTDGGDHSHTVTIDPGGGGHSHGIGGTLTVNLDTEGNDEAHENMQPTVFMNFIIKAH